MLPPVIATTRPSELVQAVLHRVTDAVREQVTADVVARCDGHMGVLVDGATSALAQALRMVARPGEAIALPDFGCVDLVAAALHAGVGVLTYDIDPNTLSPDLDSLRRVLSIGVRAVVVAPLFGFPVDYDAIRTMCTDAGVWLIEDAAQGAGGQWRGRGIGAFGDLVVLSFGRGKGVSAGRGGALVSRHAAFDTAMLSSLSRIQPPESGWRDWTVSAAVWLLARPSLYAIPSSIPSLQLGAMVFHEAQTPLRMSEKAVALLPNALRRVTADTAARAGVAMRLRAALEGVHTATLPTPLPRGNAGWLRLPLLDMGRRGACPPLGILRSYPLTIRSMREGQALLRNPATSHPGADLLAKRLLTVPTHHYVTPAVVARIAQWAVS